MKQRANPTNRTEPAGNLTTSTWNKELILTRIAQPERALQFALPFFSFNLFPFLFISSFSFSFHFSFFSLFLLSHLIFSLFLSLSYSFCSFIPFTLFNLSHLFLFLLFLLWFPPYSIISPIFFSYSFSLTFSSFNHFLSFQLRISGRLLGSKISTLVNKQLQK